jgi:hypothetical protein
MENVMSSKLYIMTSKLDDLRFNNHLLTIYISRNNLYYRKVINGGIIMFRIISIDELLKMLDGYNHKELHVHHTWKPDHKNFNGKNGIELQNSMRNYHVNTRKWTEIGQHVTLLPDGTFVTGRDFGNDPASITGYNKGAFAVETLGNFDIGNDVLEGKQKESLLRLAKYFDDKKKYVRFHRENASKTCPGTSIDKDKFMQEVRSLGSVKKYYVVTNYLPQTKDGVELNAIWYKYFTGLSIDRWYAKSNEKGIWIETQYMTKENAQALADRLSKDNLLWKLVEE